MPKVVFSNTGDEFEIEEGITILEAAFTNGIEIKNDCGGNCVCSTCHVIIDDGWEALSEIEEDEAELLEEVENLTDRSRLACQAIIYGDIEFSIP